ncbi:hypothetical protein MP638_003447 [Amoeboaphelidium occidentale]|nr:hypothetical protein MP638_003447 [Amoeboaphelidium occidentale]
MKQLPENAQSLHNLILDQIELELTDIRDVSRSFYSQLEEQTEKDGRQMFFAEEQENNFQSSQKNVLPNRMLKLQLTDGRTNLYAMEMKPISKLSVDLPLRSKIILKDVLIRRGVALLESEDNVNIVSIGPPGEPYSDRLKTILAVQPQ